MGTIENKPWKDSVVDVLQATNKAMLFDWWIKNEDRYYSERYGGNPTAKWLSLTIILHSMRISTPKGSGTAMFLGSSESRSLTTSSDLRKNGGFPQY